jgi:polyhydroxybutyrate depolymerase
MRGAWFGAVAAITALAWLTPGLAQPLHDPGGTIQSLHIGGETRTYRLETPPFPPSGRLLPVIIFLHGVNTDITVPIQARYDIPFETLAGREPALIIRPQGRDGRWNTGPRGPASWRDRIRHWVGLDAPAADDLGFLRALIDQAVAYDGGDPARVYVAGVSAGGAMTIRVACELSDKVAAVAAVVATARTSLVPICQHGRPIPFLLMASTTDPAVAYGGWPGPWGTRSAPDTAALFAQRNGCTARGEQPLPHDDPAIDSTVALIRYTGCTDGADVAFYRIDGSGHSVPSRDPAEPGDWVENGSRNRDVDTVQVIWDFWRGRVLR